MDSATVARGWDEVMASYHDEVLGPFHPHLGSTVFHVALQRALATASRRRAGAPVRVLDAGCGPGNLCAVLAAYDLPLEVVGIDASPCALSLARRRASEVELAARFYEADLASFDLSERFDVVVSVNSVLPERARTARRMVGSIFGALAMHLEPRGALVAVLPAHDALLADLERRSSGDPYALKRAERSALIDRSQRLADNGFGVPQAMHDPETIDAELPAAGLELLEPPVRLDYPSHLARAHGASLAWDWCVTARRAQKDRPA